MILIVWTSTRVEMSTRPSIKVRVLLLVKLKPILAHSWKKRRGADLWEGSWTSSQNQKGSNLPKPREEERSVHPRLSFSGPSWRAFSSRRSQRWRAPMLSLCASAHVSNVRGELCMGSGIPGVCPLDQGGPRGCRALIGWGWVMCSLTGPAGALRLWRKRQ